MELKLIVENAIDELRKAGLDSKAIDKALDYWSQISGVNVKEIDERTPFDIEMANKLLTTFPEVMSKKDEFLKTEEETIALDELAHVLEDVFEGEEQKVKIVEEETEEKLKKLVEELSETKEDVQPKMLDIKGLRMTAVLEDSSVVELQVSKEASRKPELSKLVEFVANVWKLLGYDIEGYDSFHFKKGSVVVYGERIGRRTYLVVAESETVGGAKFFVLALSGGLSK